MFTKGCSRFMEMISVALFDSLSSVVLRCVLFEISCISVPDISSAGSFVDVTVGWHKCVVLCTSFNVKSLPIVKVRK